MKIFGEENFKMKRFILDYWMAGLFVLLLFALPIYVPITNIIDLCLLFVSAFFVWDICLLSISSSRFKKQIEKLDSSKTERIVKMKNDNGIMEKFDVEKVKANIIQWIKDWFEKNGKGCNAVVGISGGKDSTVVAALCVKALGKKRVFGVLMPQNTQSDIDCSRAVCKHLGIQSFECNIGPAVEAIYNSMENANLGIMRQTEINLPARIRMSTLYAVSQSMNGRVANTCNLSEDWVGYATRYGDGAGDFSPLANLTVTEVKLVGKSLGIPEYLVEKTPIDGLCGKTDEDKMGFTYAVLDKYIRTGDCEDNATKEKIDKMHEKNLFKLQLMPSFLL